MGSAQSEHPFSGQQASWAARLARRVRDAVSEMNYASTRMAEVQLPGTLAGDSCVPGTRDHAAGRPAR